jgi:peptidoglycan/LPS O-acetylase OafA/YrhL
MRVYLLHQPLVSLSRSLWGNAGGNVFKYALIIGLPMVVSLAVAALVYRTFSLPLLKYGRAQKAARK